MNQHFLSAAYPAMSAEEFQSLKDSIEVIGVQTPVTLFEGDILDGWHRWTAALELGMTCPTVELGDVDPRDFVRAVNGKSRRHLSQSQLAAAEVKLWTWAPVGKPNPAIVAGLATNAQMAAAAGVSERTIRDAKVVDAKASPEVKAAVKAGTMPVSKAAATTRPAKPDDAKSTKRELPKAAEPPEDDLDELRESITTLAGDNDRLLDRLAVAAMDASDEERASAAVLIAELRSENRVLTVENNAIKASRDGLLIENTELKRSVASWRRKAEKVAA